METEELLGKEIVFGITGEDYVKWAETLLSKGCENENIEALASLGLESPIDTDEAKLYYNKIIKELKMSLPEKKDALMAYAKYLARQVVDKKISPENGASMLFRICREADYPKELIDWYIITEEPGHIRSDSIDFAALNQNFDQYIVKMARHLLANE
ncbi:MAG: hypothetical protein L0Y36_10240 [Planctomycetales bacterium]|nr:hypothetical protein [Planctomycetales bacterium]